MSPAGIQITWSWEAEPAEQVPGMWELLITHPGGRAAACFFNYIFTRLYSSPPHSTGAFCNENNEMEPEAGSTEHILIFHWMCEPGGTFVLADLRPRQISVGANLLKSVRASHLSLVLLILLCLQVQALQEHIFYFTASHRRQRVSADFPGLRISSSSFIVAFFPPSLPLSFFMAALELLSGLQCSNNHLIIINNHGNRMEINHSTSVYPHGNRAKTNKPYPQCPFLEIRHPAKFPTKQTSSSNCLGLPGAPMERARIFCHGCFLRLKLAGEKYF